MAFSADADRLMDRLLITELQSRYALAHDLTDPEMYAGVFSVDAELLSNGRILAKGREALYNITVNDRKRFNKNAKEGERSFGVLRHVITNSVIDLTGENTAVGVCYVTTILNEEGKGPAILSIGRYEDEYVKTAEGWLISKREIVMDMGNSDLAKASGLFGG